MPWDLAEGVDNVVYLKAGLKIKVVAYNIQLYLKTAVQYSPNQQ